jgi:CBS domain-containing protein
MAARFLCFQGGSTVNAMDVMVPAVIAIKPDDTVAEAIDLFTRHDISALPVVDDNDTVVGIN